LSPVACWAVEQRDRKVFVTTKKKAPVPKKAGSAAPAAECRENRDHRRRSGGFAAAENCGASNIREASSC